MKFVFIPAKELHAGLMFISCVSFRVCDGWSHSLIVCKSRDQFSLHDFVPAIARIVPNIPQRRRDGTQQYYRHWIDFACALHSVLGMYYLSISKRKWYSHFANTWHHCFCKLILKTSVRKYHVLIFFP